MLTIFIAVFLFVLIQFLVFRKNRFIGRSMRTCGCFRPFDYDITRSIFQAPVSPPSIMWTAHNACSNNVADFSVIKRIYDAFLRSERPSANDCGRLVVYARILYIILIVYCGRRVRAHFLLIFSFCVSLIFSVRVCRGVAFDFV